MKKQVVQDLKLQSRGFPQGGLAPLNMSLDQARALCAVVDSGGYNKAAEKLFKSHSALVYMVKGLEKQCGFDLFDRQSYRNSLTPSGRRVYEKCLEILAKVDDLQLLCGQISGGWEPSLRLVFDGILPFEPFLQIYKTFKAEKIPTVVQTYADYLQDVEKTYFGLGADMMISILPVRHRDLEAIHLRPFKSLLLAHKDHPIHHSNKRWSIDDLHQFYFLTVRGSDKNLGLNTLEFEESASFFISDFSVKKEAIMKKIGFGWLPEHLVEAELKNRTLIPLKWERKSSHEIQPILYVRKNAIGGKAVQLITEILKK